MRISNLSPRIRGSLAVFVAALLSPAAMSRSAYAYGGFWSSQTTPIRASSVSVLFVDNPDSTVTAIVQIGFAGPPQKFAWLIPVPGKPTIGVSSNTVFLRLDAATAPRYWVEVAVEGTCRLGKGPDAAPDGGSGAYHAPGAGDTPASPPLAIGRGSLGPYDYADLKVDASASDPAKTAADWLEANGYEIAGLDRAVLSPYLKDGFHLLAFKLASDADAGALRPVVLTYEGKLPTIPVRLMAPTAQKSPVVIKVWVIGPSQAVPVNYKSLVINDALIDWLSGRNYVAGTLPAGGVGPFDPAYLSQPNNYDAVVAAAAGEAGGQGFVTELGAPASQYRDKIWSALDKQQLAAIATQKYADGIDAVLAANRYYRDWDGYREAVEGATTLPTTATFDEFSRRPDLYRGVAKVDPTRLFQLLDEKVVKPVADTAAMLSRGPYLTRLHGVTGGSEMTVDPVFDFNSDLALVGNTHIAKQFVRCGATVDPHDAPWRIELPQGGLVVAKGSGGWPPANTLMPANLKIVQLSTTGPGAVVKDNGEDVGMKVFGISGATGKGLAVPRSPQNGVLIGGTQTLIQHDWVASSQGGAKPSGGGMCSVSRVGDGTAPALALWVPLAQAIRKLRRRRPHRCGRSEGAEES